MRNSITTLIFLIIISGCLAVPCYSQSTNTATLDDAVAFLAKKSDFTFEFQQATRNNETERKTKMTQKLCGSSEVLEICRVKEQIITSTNKDGDEHTATLHCKIKAHVAYVDLDPEKVEAFPFKDWSWVESDGDPLVDGVRFKILGGTENLFIIRVAAEKKSVNLTVSDSWDSLSSGGSQDYPGGSENGSSIVMVVAGEKNAGRCKEAIIHAIRLNKAKEKF